MTKKELIESMKDFDDDLLVAMETWKDGKISNSYSIKPVKAAVEAVAMGNGQNCILICADF